MSIHPDPDFDQPLQADESWMTPEQTRKVETIYLETLLDELEAERRMDRNAPFDEQIRYGIQMLQEKLNQITQN